MSITHFHQIGRFFPKFFYIPSYKKYGRRIREFRILQHPVAAALIVTCCYACGDFSRTFFGMGFSLTKASHFFLTGGILVLYPAAGQTTVASKSTFHQSASRKNGAAAMAAPSYHVLIRFFRNQLEYRYHPAHHRHPARSSAARQYRHCPAPKRCD